MRSSQALSPGCSPSPSNPETRGVRLQWRPSRWLATALAGIACAAAGALHATQMPAAWAWPGSLLVLTYGAWRVRRELQQAPLQWVFRDDGSAALGGLPVDDLRLTWRGPLLFVTWRDGTRGRHRLSWWPDTLPGAQRRELRLAVPAGLPDGARETVAP